MGKKIVIKTEDVDKTCEAIEAFSEVYEDYLKAKDNDGKVSAIEWLGIGAKNVTNGIKIAKAIPEIGNELLDLELNEVPEIEKKLIELKNFSIDNPFLKKAASDGANALVSAKNCAISILQAKQWEKDNT